MRLETLQKWQYKKPFKLNDFRDPPFPIDFHYKSEFSSVPSKKIRSMTPLNISVVDSSGIGGSLVKIIEEWQLLYKKKI